MWFGRRNGSRRRLNVEEPPFSQTHSTEGLLCLKCPSLGASARRQGAPVRSDGNTFGGGSGVCDFQARLDTGTAAKAGEAGAGNAPPVYRAGESLSLGRRYLLTVVHREAKPSVSLDHKRITLTVRPGSDAAKRAEAMHAWHKMLLHHTVPPLIGKWEQALQVAVRGYFLQRMKTKWGSCNRQAGHIRLNTELVKKPKDLLEYVIVHEMAHLIEPTHSVRFLAILDEHYPTWREARAELNELPLASEAWTE